MKITNNNAVNFYAGDMKNEEEILLKEMEDVSRLILTKLKYAYDAKLVESSKSLFYIIEKNGDDGEPFSFDMNYKDYDGVCFKVISTDDILLKATDDFLSISKFKETETEVETVWKIVLLGETSLFYKINHGDLEKLKQILSLLEKMDLEIEYVIGEIDG